MKKFILVSLFIFLIMPKLSYSQEHSIILESVSNTYQDTLMLAGKYHKFQLRITNNTPDTLNWLVNAFRIYSDDGATWFRTTGKILNDFSHTFTQLFVLPHFSTGTVTDTIGFSGGTSTGALFPYYDSVAYEITIGPTDPADHGKHICIDSSLHPGSDPWRWETNSGNTVYPLWSGQRCWTIVSCDSLNSPDSDLDGVPDVCDRCPGFDDYSDSDFDGISDGCDICLNDAANDRDGDGICGDIDNCPLTYNPGQEDSDGDGIGDECENLFGPKRIALELVTFSINDTLLLAGFSHDFIFRVQNFDTVNFYPSNFTNGFRVFSNDGATWGNTTGEWVNNFDFNFGLSIINSFSITGTNADTVGFAGYTGGAEIKGIPANYNDLAYKVTIGPTDVSDHGKTICIDSSWWSPGGTWKWVNKVTLDNYFPAWSGQKCYMIYDLSYGCCFGMTGNIDYDPKGGIDISDATKLIDYLFISESLPLCLPTANVDGKGFVDVSDLTRLIDFLFITHGTLEPCE